MNEQRYGQGARPDGAYPPQVNPFTDQREDADDHWARNVEPPRQLSSDGYWGPAVHRRPNQEDWAVRGYHMEDASCDDAEPIDDANDPNYMPEDNLPQLPLDYELDGLAEDDGVDEHLADVRSKNVRDKKNSFWQTVKSLTGSQKIVPVEAEDETTEASGEHQPTGKDTRSGPVTPVHAQPGARAILLVMGVIVVLLVVGMIVYNSMFSVHSIAVQGNSYISDEDVVSRSGIRIGANVLMLDEPAIAAAVEGNRYIKLVRVDHDNHNVVLQVHERRPIAYVRVNGIYYTMDNRGMVLEEYASSEAMPSGLMQLENMKLHGCLVGRHISFANSELSETFLQLMLEIKAMDLGNTIASVNLGDLNNILLDTTDGFFVQLGDATYLHGKLRAMLLTKSELLREGLSGGTINVSDRMHPSYQPE